MQLTTEITFHHDCIILDASCIISLYASRQMGEILKAIPKSVTIATFVFEKEALWIYGGSDEDVQADKEAIDLQPFVDAGLLRLVKIASAETNDYVNLAAKLDPGEAITGAIAMNRNWAIATDDNKARSLFQREVPHLQLVYTLGLVKYWVDSTNPSFETVTSALKNIRTRAIYKPGQNHPLYSWWRKYR